MNLVRRISQVAGYFVIAPAAIAAAVFCTGAHAEGYRVTEVSAHATKVYTYTAYPGERFFVRVSGDGDTDVDLRIIGPAGGRACVSNGPTDDEDCTVYSPYGGNYRIEVENLGRIWNRVELFLI